MNKQPNHPAKKSVSPEDIVIDPSRGLVFSTEEQLYDHFLPQIQLLEEEYLSMREADDYTDEEQEGMEHYLELTLEDPDEVWEDEATLGQTIPLCHFIRKISDELYYVASTYVADDTPTFVFIHFATKTPELFENYKRGELIYDETYRDLEYVTIEGDALEEADPLAIGLLHAMITLRSDKDIAVEDFADYAELRELTIESADEIWKNTDLSGNGLVTFVREFPDQDEGELFYVVITLEDEAASVHALLFSFPTNDRTLVQRYCQGENLQAEEVTQESRH